MLKTSFHSGCEADGGLDVDEDAAGSTSGGSVNGGGGKASVGMVLASRCGIGRSLERGVLGVHVGIVRFVLGGR